MIFKSKRKHSLYQKGFTLIELVIYMGLMSILVGVLGMIFATIVDVQLESESTSSIDQDGRYILSKLLHDFHSNDPVVIELPASVGVSTTSLRINLNNETTDNTYSIDGGGNLILVNGYGTNVLNSINTSISNFNVVRYGLGDSNDTVRVSFTLTSRVQRPNGFETKSFQSSFAGP